MKHLFKIFLLYYCIIFIACNKQTAEPVDVASITVSFQAIYDGEPLIIGPQKYAYDGNFVKFTNIHFYLANLVAINNDGETELSEIQFINLSTTHQTPANAAKGTIISFDKVPVGTYNYLKFGIGVPSDLNKTTPADYATNHPLGANNSEAYLEDLNSYIFVRIEGQYDKNGDGIFDSNDINFDYPVGTNNALQPPIEKNKLIMLNLGETTSLNFELDVKQLLSFGNGELIDLQAPDPVNQSAEKQNIIRNFKKALQLK